MCILVYQFLFFHQNPEILLSDFKSIFRVLLAPFYFCYFYDAISSQSIKKENLRQIILIYGLLYGLLMIIPYLSGTGFVSYDIDNNGLMSKAYEAKGIGNKGFFIELNSLIAILAASLFFIKNLIICYFYEEKIKKAVVAILLYIIILISLFITATKLGIILSIVCSLIFVYQVLYIEIKREYKILFFIGILLLFTNIYFLLGDLIESILGRLAYFSGKSNGSTINFLTSNRVSYLTETMHEIDDSKHRLFIYLEQDIVLRFLLQMLK
ncbi:MAG: O-antigen ligase family protein [Enterococcus lacertideformus]|uniref:O-antigen ligase family protein n=1 Tax=Enterococcus lacertideformus TaxID=2771493 RepID=A0A931FBW3_9ENTE|nr:O-antigen ligase family protein [Enterococcus lacertideformus]